MYRDFCVRHNLTPLTEVFLDRGRSGYKDEHRKKGRLGVLISYAREGAFEPGSVIVIEAWDRLGRLRPDKQTELVAELLRTGIDIGVCQLNDVFAESDFGTHKWIVLSTFIMLAYQESRQKGERVAHSWQSRRERARESGKLVTGRLPAWLEMNGEGCRLIPERAATVKRIFKLACQGSGRARIVAALIAEGFAPFGAGGRWTHTYVGKILSDRRVLGEYQPRKVDLTPDGAPIPDYYPRIIDDETWALARAAQEGRRGKDKLGRALVRSERKHVNTFRGLLTSALDGQGFMLQQRGPARKPRFMLCNLAGQAGAAPTIRISYDIFEQAFLRCLREVNPADVLPPAQKGASKAEVIRAELANVRRDLDGLKEDLRAGYSRRLAALLREKEDLEEVIAGRLQDELARSARPAERGWREFPTLADLITKKGDEARLRLRVVLRGLIDDVRVVIVRRGCWRLCGAQAIFTGGACRAFLIASQAGGYNRKGGWAACSLGGLAPEDFDLRTLAGARNLEQYLLSLDLARLNGEED
jgi:DNA invertase Pin-like site-specific DNA recombinase